MLQRGVGQCGQRHAVRIDGAHRSLAAPHQKIRKPGPEVNEFLKPGTDDQKNRSKWTRSSDTLCRSTSIWTAACSIGGGPAR